MCGILNLNKKHKTPSTSKNSNDLPIAPISEFENDTSKEKEILKREKIINEKESELNRRENNLISREFNINTREKNINLRENEIEQRNQNFYNREYSNNQRNRNQICNENNKLIPQNFNNNSNINKINSKNKNNKKLEFNNLKESNIDKIRSNNSYDKSYMQEYIKNEEKKKKEIEKAKEFYDMVLDFSNFEQLRQDGQKIKWPNKSLKEAQEKYNKCNENKNVVVGILGNKNRGKSFLLGRIIGKDNFINKNGFLVTTQGISANFPLLGDNTNIITLDTAGKDNPLLDSSNFIKNSASSSTSKDKSKTEHIKNIARDQRVSEIVLSDFIIKESDVLITVLEQLSFAEQDMLKNLINQLKSKKMEANSIKEKNFQ